MKLSVILHTSVFRGDHHADVTYADELRPGETVEQLVERLVPDRRDSYHDPLADVIEIRRIREATP